MVCTFENKFCICLPMQRLTRGQLHIEAGSVRRIRAIRAPATSSGIVGGSKTMEPNVTCTTTSSNVQRRHHVRSLDRNVVRGRVVADMAAASSSESDFMATVTYLPKKSSSTTRNVYGKAGCTKTSMMMKRTSYWWNRINWQNLISSHVGAFSSLIVSVGLSGQKSAR